VALLSISGEKKTTLPKESGYINLVLGGYAPEKPWFRAAKSLLQNNEAVYSKGSSLLDLGSVKPRSSSRAAK